MPTPLVSPSDARALVDAGALVLDTRSALRFLAEGHIPGAARVSWRIGTSGDRHDGALGPADAAADAFAAAGVRGDTPVLVVGDWDAGWGEEGRVFWDLEYLGHPGAHVLHGGMRAWTGPRAHLDRPVRAGAFTAAVRPELRVTTEALAEALRGPTPPTVLDVREPSEFGGQTPHGERRGGHIPGARSLPWRALLHTPPTDLGGPVVVTCTGGVRSGMAYVMLRQHNVPYAANHDQGMWHWSTTQNPLT